MIYPSDDQHVGFHYKFTVGGKDRVNASIYRTDGLIVIAFIKRDSTIIGFKQQQLRHDSEVLADVQEILEDTSKSVYNGETLTANDVLTVFHKLQNTSVSDLQTDYSAQEQPSTPVTTPEPVSTSQPVKTPVAEPKTASTRVSKESAYAILRAKRLDAGDACNITDPVDVISPCGCHYSNNDLQFLLEKKYCSDVPEAYTILANNEKYKSLSADVQQKVDNGTIKLDNASLLEYFQLSEDDVTTAVQTNNYDKIYGNPSANQKKEAADQNTVPDPREAVGMKVGVQDNNTGTDIIASAIRDNRPIAENDFAQWLLENVNRIFRDDSRTPQIPTSVGVSIAMVRGTNSPAVFGRYNWWKLPYDSALTNIPQDSEDCAFNAPRDGIIAMIDLLHTDDYKEIIKQLKPQMWDDTEEDKQYIMRAVLLQLSNSNIEKAEEDYRKAMDYVIKFNMREWDTEKKEDEGGHADTKANSSDDSKRAESRMSTAVKHFTEILRDKGIGVLVIPLGPNYSKIIKLPVGKTHCEPVYPDFVTVGDRIPEWVMSESYAKLAKEAEEAALKAAGIVTQSQDEIELEYINNQIEAFKEEQFAAWCAANGIPYTNETEKETAKKLYAEAAAKDPENFTDGVYTPDDASRALYKRLLQEKATILSNGDVAVATARAQYLEAADVAVKEISDRESGWNQDSGHALSAAELGNAGGTDFSAVPSGGTLTDSDNAGSSSSSGSTGDMEKAIAWAESKKGAEYATFHKADFTDENGETVYVTDSGRDGPKYDCSSLVYWALINGGFTGLKAAWEQNKRYAIFKEHGATQTVGDVDTLWTDIQKMGGQGWEKLGGSTSLKRGDITVFNGFSHIAMMVSESKTIEARGKDQPVNNYDISGRSLAEVYRYTKPVNTDTGSSTSSKIEKMVQWALNIAADQTHGYSKANRTGPDYDCSSFTYYALEAGGFNAIQVNGGYAGTTSTIWDTLQKIGGWQRYSYSNVSSSIRRGDLLHRESGHLAIAISNDKTVEASGVNSGQGSPATGDQGREIDSYNIQGRSWDYVYRYTGSDTGGSSGTSDIISLISNSSVGKSANQIFVMIATSNHNGGNPPSTCQCYWLQKNGSSWQQTFNVAGKYGINGVVNASQRVVGSKTTPLGLFDIDNYAYGIKSNPGAAMPYHQAVTSDDYMSVNDTWNSGSVGEVILSVDGGSGCYNYFLNINFARKYPGQGSCLFIHCPSGSNGTGGCVAIPENYMITLLKQCKAGAKALYVANKADISRY